MTTQPTPTPSAFEEMNPFFVASPHFAEKWAAWSSGRSEGGRKLLVPQLECRAHDAESEVADSPTPRAWDLGDESIDVEPMQEPADLGAALPGIVVQTECGGAESSAQVAVGEAAERVSAVHQGGEVPRASCRESGLKGLAGRVATLDPWVPTPRSEVAQVLRNLLLKMRG